MSQLFISGRFRGFLDSGLPNVSGRLYTFASGTTAFQAAYADAALSVPCAYAPDGADGQAIVLDARGEAECWLGAGMVYTMRHTTPTGVVIDTTDGVQAVSGGGVSVGPLFVDGEIPAGAIDGSNTVFLLAHAPSPALSLELFLNGVKQRAGVDYTLASNTITDTIPPATGDSLEASYRY